MRNKKTKLSPISSFHYIRLFCRSLLFLCAAAMYILNRVRKTEGLLPNFKNAVWILAVIWVAYAVEMALRFFPARLESMGCQKQFARNFKPTETGEKPKLTSPGRVWAVVAAWAAVTAGQRRISELKRKITLLGTPNLGAIEEYARVNERYSYLVEQRDDVLTSKRDLEGIIRNITQEMTAIFVTEFAKIDHYFGQTFEEMFGGGKGQLVLEDPENPLTCGIEIRVQPPGKQLKTITLLSGGEKAFVAIALYFAILKVRPTPFCMLDEIDAALDDRNVERFASYLHNLSQKTQFIVITHRRGTMEASDVLYGVTMQEQGVSKLLRLDLNQMEEYLGIME
ncbi:MAG: hypothetical protein II350_00335 [Clostridia bacterium]|nr:hypothetical protein [Clostridia bacterium]